MKKILCILQLPPPIHGASLMNSYLVESELINNNFNIKVINLQFASSGEDLEKFSLLKISKALKYAITILKQSIKFRPDLVYFTLSCSGYAFYRDAIYVGLLKMCNLKILYHLHSKGIKKESSKNFLKKKLYKWVFQNTEVICLAHSLTEDIRHVSSSSPFIVPCGIPIHAKSKQEVTKKNSVLQILFLSNYIEKKGIFKLIDALRILKDQEFTFIARLVGAPTDLSIETIENYTRERNLQNCIQVVGPRYGDEKYNEFLNADIFAFPTFYSNETFGLVNLEAMQFKLPIVTTDEGGISEVVIDEVTGFVVEPKNVEQLADKMKILMKNKDLREKMGMNGKDRFLENFTVQHFEHNIKKVFDTILKTGHCQ